MGFQFEVYSRSLLQAYRQTRDYTKHKKNETKKEKKEEDKSNRARGGCGITLLSSPDQTHAATAPTPVTLWSTVRVAAAAGPISRMATGAGCCGIIMMVHTSHALSWVKTKRTKRTTEGRDTRQVRSSASRAHARRQRGVFLPV